MELTRTLSTLVPHQGFVLVPSGLSQPSWNHLLKSISWKNLWIRHSNEYTFYQRTKINRITKNSSMTDIPARNIFCHIWDLFYQKNYLNPRIQKTFLWLFFPKCNQHATKERTEKQKSMYLILLPCSYSFQKHYILFFYFSILKQSSYSLSSFLF